MRDFNNWPDRSQISLLPSDPCGSYNPDITFEGDYKLYYEPMKKLTKAKFTVIPVVKAAR